MGGLVHAAQANNDLATGFMKTSLFMRVSYQTLPYLFWLNLAWIVPATMQRWFIARRQRKQKI